MENLILESIYQMKEVSRKNVSLNNIINRMKKSCATNMDDKSLTFQFEQMITESLIYQNYEILITGSPQQIKTGLSLEKTSFKAADKNRDQENAITNKSLPFIGSQDNHVTKSKSTTTCERVQMKA